MSDERRCSALDPPELRLILLGNIGCGKTLSADTLLGESSPQSSSRICQRRCRLSEGRQLTVVETPRWYWSGGRLEADTRKETERALQLATPGPHAFLFLVPVGEFTEVEKRVPGELEEIFGKGVLKHTLLLITCGDYLLGKEVEEYQAGEGSCLRELVDRFEGRWHVFNNRKHQERGQVRTLLEKVERMVQANGGCYLKGAQQMELEERVRQNESQLTERYREKKGEEESIWNSYSETRSHRKQTKKVEPFFTEAGRREMEVEDEVALTHLANGLQTLPTAQHSPTASSTFRLSSDGALLCQLADEKPKKKLVTTLFHRIPSFSKDPVPVSLSPRPSLSSSAFPSHSAPELRLLLLGRTGAGKSGVGNTILGKEEFVSRVGIGECFTQECDRKTSIVAGHQVSIVEAPGWICSERPLLEVKQQLTACLALSAPGPHAFLLCVPVDQTSGPELRLLTAMEGVVGPSAVRGRTLVLFTHSDRLQESGGVEEYIIGQRKDLLQLVERCGDRYHVLEKGRGAGASVKELLGKVHQAVKESGGTFYSHPSPREAEAGENHRGGGRERGGSGGGEVLEQARVSALHSLPEMDEEGAERERAREEVIGGSTQKLDTTQPLNSSSPPPSFLRSVCEKVFAGLKRVPKLIAGGALLGGMVGVFLAGPLGGAVGAAVGSVATEVGRKRYNSRMKSD